MEKGKTNLKTLFVIIVIVLITVTCGGVLTCFALSAISDSVEDDVSGDISSGDVNGDIVETINLSRVSASIRYNDKTYDISNGDIISLNSSDYRLFLSFYDEDGVITFDVEYEISVNVIGENESFYSSPLYFIDGNSKTGVSKFYLDDSVTGQRFSSQLLTFEKFSRGVDFYYIHPFNFCNKEMVTNYEYNFTHLIFTTSAIDTYWPSIYTVSGLEWGELNDVAVANVNNFECQYEVRINVLNSDANFVFNFVM